VPRIEKYFTLVARKTSTHQACNNFSQLDQSILAKAFRGELVPQDPTDEPASILLDRIRAEREKNKTPKKKSTQRKSTQRK